ncbi:bifunctional DNA primase/polymerase [Bordetella bronchialis]|uniref:DNA primase/polymerase bifunctional N-terminal domain-containing protein n=1 Tax=Bordetella bronchialis TaxID=463025 RepID=A0ABN4QZT2_9BORD|nr:bifunctional DNA primase/polymerase [Bordetella bronchialis]ANN66456.1 hypothetical protein BAU06_09255 [Bordetella bronchialis]
MAAIIPLQQAQTTALDYALAYAGLGWHVFPAFGIKDGACSCGNAHCKNPGKHPIGWLARKGQDDATTDPDRIRGWWTAAPEANVAIMLKPSGLVAIDIDPRNGGWDSIDDLEAKHGGLVSDVLQLTGGGGEHRIFRLDPDEGLALPGKLGAGVDVKRNGYIIAEPSTHISGRTYQWEASSNPLDGVMPPPLPDWLRGTFGGAAAPQTLPPAEPRALTEQDRADLQSALQAIPSDDREDWVQVGMALHSTAAGGEAFMLWDAWSRTCPEKYDARDCTRVWASFRNKGLAGVSKATIFAMAQARGWVNARVTAPVPAAQVVIATPTPTTDAPANLLHPPGILGDMARWVDATSRKPQPQFAVQAAIAFCCTVMGRRFVTTQRNWPSLYLLNIGKSASGKEHAKWAVEKALDQCGLSRLIGPASYTSDSGLLSALLHQPSHFTVIDEFGKVLESASVKHNNRAQSTLRALMEVWGRCDGAMRPQGYSTFGMSASEAAKLAERTVRNPALTLLAMTTPESFFDTIGSAAARDGFLNRFLTVESDIGRQPSRSPEFTDLPRSIIEWAAEVRAMPGTQLVSPDTNASLEPIAQVVGITAAAQRLFDAFETECLADMDAYEDAGMAEMFGRTREIAMRLALVVAVGCRAPTVSDDHARWAIDYARHFARRTAERLRTCVADSEFDALKKQVYALILAAGEQGLTVRELARKSRRFSQVDRRGQENVLSSLQFLGDIAFVEMASMAGRKRQAYVAVNVEADSMSPGDSP